VKILFLCHRLPFPPHRGGVIRPFNILRHLGRDHAVTVATVRRSTDAAAAEALGALTAARIVVPLGGLSSWVRSAAALPTPSPSSFAHFRSGRLARAVAAELERGYDLVFVHCSSMAPYVRRAPCAAVLDFGDLDSRKWLAYGRRRRLPLALVYRLEAAKVAAAERAAATRFDLCTCATPAELATLERYGVARQTGWFPNGVDAAYFHPSDAPADPDAICFLGRMDYFPNQDAMRWFCDDILPAVRARRPRAHLTIIGAAPSRAIRRLAKRPGIRVTGAVADVRPEAWRAAVSVAPLRIARGTQNKVLESLAMGLPVVATPRAARGTITVPGEHLLVAAEPRDFAAAVVHLLEDAAARRRFAAAGRRQMLAAHDWTASMRRLDALLADCMARPTVSLRPMAGVR
jgi:sugar transferase (PEP-CTERM/EpsH1 system associated)